MKHFISTLLVTILLAGMSFSQKLGQTFVLPQNRQQVLVVEFESPGEMSIGRVLSRIFAHQIAREVRPGGGASFLSTRNPDDRISERPENVNAFGQKHKAAFVMWGEFYEEDEGYYVYSYLRMVSQQGFNSNNLALSYNTGESEITSSLPSSQTNFTPILFLTSELQRLSQILESPMTIRINPEDESPEAGRLLPSDDYTIIDFRGDWTKVVVSGAITGWIKNPISLTTRDSLALFPITQYLVGLTQYASGEFQQSSQTFSAFTKSFGKTEDNTTVGIAHVLTGNSLLRMNPSSPDTSLFEHYHAATKLLPNNPSPVNHLTIARLVMLGDNPAAKKDQYVSEFRDSEIKMIETVQHDPNPQSVNNLQAFYRMAAKYDLLRPGNNPDRSDYDEAINDRLDLLSQIRRQELKITIVRPTPDIQSIRLGLWSPKDFERSFIFRDSIEFQAPDAKISQTNTFGIDFQHRARILPTLFFDFSVSLWHSSYKLSEPKDTSLIKKADAWAVFAPITIGLSYSIIETETFQPFVMAGAGLTGAFNSKSVLLIGGETEKDTDVDFGFGGFLGGGLDIFLSEKFALSLGVKYQFISFKDILFTGQKNMSGFQLSFGVSNRI